jgi:hypothetical protein
MYESVFGSGVRAPLGIFDSINGSEEWQRKCE